MDVVAKTTPLRAPRETRSLAGLCFRQTEPTPGLEPGTPSLRETPEGVSAGHPRPLEDANDQQMWLFEADSEERP